LPVENTEAVLRGLSCKVQYAHIATLQAQHMLAAQFLQDPGHVLLELLLLLLLLLV
jgi:hypothetical protein